MLGLILVDDVLTFSVMMLVNMMLDSILAGQGVMMLVNVGLMRGTMTFQIGLK